MRWPQKHSQLATFVESTRVADENVGAASKERRGFRLKSVHSLLGEDVSRHSDRLPPQLLDRRHSGLGRTG